MVLEIFYFSSAGAYKPEPWIIRRKVGDIAEELEIKNKLNL